MFVAFSDWAGNFNRASKLKRAGLKFLPFLIESSSKI